jgi:hypothetical protein
VTNASCSAVSTASGWRTARTRLARLFDDRIHLGLSCRHAAVRHRMAKDFDSDSHRPVDDRDVAPASQLAVLDEQDEASDTGRHKGREVS